MLKVALVLGLAVAALATTGVDKDVNRQVVRLGSVGARYSFIKGIVVPHTDYEVKGIPAYELRRMVKGVPQPEEDLVHFRCQHVEKMLVPVEAVDRPVHLCRNLHWKESDTGKMTFLFSAEELKTIPDKKEIDLWVGKTMSQELISGVHTRVLDDTTEHVIRVGSIGTDFAHLNGLLVPYTEHVTEGIPAYEFRSLVNGVAKHEEGLIDFRCGLLEDYYVPIATESKPVYMCRHINPAATCASHKKTFLFSAEKLNIEPGKKTIDLWLGKTMWHDFVSDVYTTHTNTPTTFHDDIMEHTIRIGSIGTQFADLRGVLMPYTKGAVKGIPSYELRSIVKGVPVEERDLISFRCHHLDEFYIPVETVSKPVYMCRSLRGMREISSADKMVFLFSAEHFDIPAAAKTFDLWLGRTLWHDFTSDVYAKVY